MPYIPQSRRQELLEDGVLARTVGEVNFVFSNLFIKIFRADKSYRTLNYLRKIVNIPSTHPDFETMFYHIPLNGSGLEASDIRAALDNAWDEFYIRVGREYEDTAIRKNGDIYSELLLEINHVEKTQTVSSHPSVQSHPTETV